jgi:hypothetical protein
MPAALRFMLVLVLIALVSAVLAVRERTAGPGVHQMPPSALR